jgi:hypothetical protein
MTFTVTIVVVSLALQIPLGISEGKMIKVCRDHTVRTRACRSQVFDAAT